MAAPTYSAGAIGGVLNGVSLAAGKNAAALVDLSTVLGGKLTCQMATGATPPTVSTTFALYAVAGATAAGNTTLAATATGGSSTTLTVASSVIAAQVQKGQKIALVQAANASVGELVTVSSVSGATLTLSAAVINSYAAADLVFIIEQTASGGSLAPGTSWSANSTYGGSIYPAAAFVWILDVTNGDATNSVAITVTLDKNPAFS